MTLAAVILAAGASRRMGSPKALLPFEGQCFLERAIRLYAPCCDPILVVLGHDAATIRGAIAGRPGVHFVENPEPDRGMLSSLQCGLAALPPLLDGFLFSPVDLPAIEPATIRTICDRFERTVPQPPVAMPRYDGRRGHPVLCAAVLKEEFLALSDQGQPRDVIERHKDRALYVDVDDPAILTDVDFPEDYQRLLAHQV